MSTLTKRVITAVVLVVMVGTVLFTLPAEAALGLFSLVLLWGLWEWSGFLVPAHGLGRLILILGGILLGVGLLALERADVDTLFIIYAAVLWWLGLAIWLTKRDKHIANPFTAAAGLLCLVPAWLALRVIMGAELGPWLLIWLLAIVAAADIGAYFAGRTLGRHKLAPHLSPGKTVEGLVGGLLCAALAAAVGALQFGLEPWLYALLGPLVAAVSVVGDLTVSAFKRHAQLKDTGWILPGHGGVMDRVDSLVAAAPVFVAVLAAAGPLA